MGNARLRRLAWLAPILAGIFLGYACYLHDREWTLPPVAEEGAGERTELAARPVLPPAGKYAPLAAGRIFFGGGTAAAEESDGYVSGFVLRGIIHGPNPSAVLTRAGASPDGESYTVRVGQEILGERVAAIEKDRVVLSKNGKETVLSLVD